MAHATELDVDIIVDVDKGTIQMDPPTGISVDLNTEQASFFSMCVREWCRMSALRNLSTRLRKQDEKANNDESGKLQ